ncbi:MAG TPA: DNA gyrase subunit A, partial [Saprospiraceae bacterium]|nr:DNA gyrase subunit A [Saprospiraceae bacterium]
MSENQKIIPVNIEEQMKSAYIDYSMSVIVARALPDVRDGLKPVHRRVLFGMSELGMSHTKPYKKSARIVGEVLGKYHPHGDSSVYDAMIRMAQEWSLRYPLVEGQGNFGSVDGDSPAAMRYTEARLQRISDEMLNDLDKETVDFALNFDDSLEEPTVLPTKFPNLLVNGATGIAVGMATNMLPHNLTEVVDGILATMDNPDITTEGLMEHIKGPDFPTGGIIYGIKGVKEAFETGRGRVVVRGRAEIETSEQGRESIIITEIPYQVNKANLVIKIAELVNEKKIEGISDIRDESDRKGMRIVVDVKRDAMANVILSKLYKFTPLQSYFGVNNIALVRGRPVVLNLKNLITEFVKFRLEVIVRRTRYELRKAEERAHILEGLLIALDHLDEVITLIRNSQTVEEAKDGLMSRFGLSEIQAKAILEMRLQRLTGLERDKIKNEYDELLKTIERLKAILASEALQMDIIREELTEIKNKFGDKRKTEITFDDADIRIEDMIEDESVVISISHLGYIKRTKATEYKTQGRGGRGAMGSRTRDQDFVDQIFVASNHDYILFFTEQGKCYWLRVYELPETSRTSAGRVVQNLMNIDKDDKIKAYIVVKDLQNTDFINSHYIVFATRKGVIKKTILEAFSRPRANGINAITINEGDELLDAKLTTGNSEILMAIKSGRAIRFPERTVRPMGRSATGVRGVSLADDNDKVVGLICVDPEDATQTILVVSENGFGKRSLLEDYRITNRGGKGVKTINVTEKTGELVTIKVISDEDDLMITNRSGILIRIAASGLRVMGRATQGVK